VGCTDEENNDEVLAPSNLTVSSSQPAEQPGVVTVTASAQNANFYRFFFEDQENFVQQNSGTASYTYRQEGTYTITIQAHTTAQVFVSQSIDVNIELENGGLPSLEGYTTPESYAGYTLVWRDEFEGTSLSSDWTYEIGTGSNGWGNNELQYYRSENTSVANGLLTIEARREEFSGRNYTSSRIITEDRREFQYGRIDIRAKLPQGQGLWPALWMLGGNFREAGWPFCGEIDIMEMIGGQGRENTVHGTIHWDNNGQYANFGRATTKQQGTFYDKFHVFTIIWDETAIRWYVDDVEYNVVDITPSALSEFRQQYFFIFNVAVGGNWPGSPDGSTTFPQQMQVDYVRVFQAD